MLNYVVVLLIFIACIAGTVRTQEVKRGERDTVRISEYPLYELDPVEVTANRIERPVYRVPLAIDIVRQEEIQRAKATLSLNEAIRAIPGLVVDNRYNPS